MVRASATVNLGPDPLKSANQIHEAVGPQIAAILNRAMAQRPEDRYADAQEFREALRRMGRTNQASEGVDSRISKQRLAENRKFSSDGRAGLIWPTVHIDDITSAPGSAGELKMPLVVSARRFGPAGATAVIAILLTLAGGIIYGAKRWFPVAEEVTNAASVAPGNAAPALRQTTAKKSERPRAVDNVEVAATKTRTVADANIVERVAEKRNFVEPAQPQHEKKIASISPAAQADKRLVSTKSQPVSNRGQEAQREIPRREVRPVGAPNIRFPSLNFRDAAPAASPDWGIRGFGSAEGSQRAASNAVPKGPSGVAPKFYRAADGTQIVKFSDGSTQFVRPGERSGQAKISQKR
jgi:hypothetical protein